MQRRVSTAIGALAGAVAVATIVVFGYLSLVTPLRPGARRAGGGPGKGGAGGAGGGGFALVKPEHLVDRDYLFQIDAPDSSWRLFDHVEADRGWPDQNAVMLSDTGVVELRINRLGDMPLDQAEAVVVGWRGVEPAARQSVQWLGRPAVELRFEVDKRETYDRLVMRDGYVYTLSLTPFSSAPPLTDADRDRIWGALTLIDGRVAPGPYAPAPRDLRGPTWRIASGRWESAVAELAVEPAAGWRLLAGRDLSRRGGYGDLQLVNLAAGCYISISLDVVIDPAARLGTAVLAADVAGEPHELIETKPSRVSRMWKGQLDLDGLDVVIDAWGPAADGDAALAELRRGLASIRRATAAERDAVAADLAAAPYHPTVIGDHWVDRNGTFVDYDTDLVWARPPDGAWTVTVGPAAAKVLPGAEVTATDLRGQVSFALGVDDDIVKARPPAKWLAATYRIASKPIDLTALHPNLRNAVEGHWADHKVDHVHQVGALVGDDGRALRVNIWGARGQVAAAGPRLAMALGGAVVANVRASDDQSGMHVDRRWGFAMNLPGWDYKNRYDDTEVTDQLWSTPTGLIGLTVELGPSATDKATMVRGRNLASANVGTGINYPVKSSRTTIGGESALRLTWSEQSTLVAVILVEHHELVYTLYTRGDQSTLHELESSFRFIDNPASDT